VFQKALCGFISATVDAKQTRRMMSLVYAVNSEGLMMKTGGMPHIKQVGVDKLWRLHSQCIK